MARGPGTRARLLVLGAGPAQLGLLEAARARADVEVVAVDRDPAAVGFELADDRAVLSSEDEPAIDRLARALEVDGIVSPGADWPVGIAARVAERMGIPHPIDGRTAAIVTSKHRQRERFAAEAVPHARSLDPNGGRLEFPCVVKAPDRQGQRGLTLVSSHDDFAEAVARAVAEARNGGVLVEEYVDGPEVTVNAVSIDGVFHVLAVTDRLTADPPAFGVALAHAWPSVASNRSVVEVARRAVEAVGICHGPSYTQLRVGERGPVVMEVAARLGGGHDAELVREVSGIDLNDLAVGFALGEPVALDPVEPTCAGAAIAFIVPPEGTLSSVDGLDDARALDGVVWVRTYRSPGQVLGPLRRGADRAGAALAVASSRDGALACARRATEAVRFRVDADTP